ncbi:MAG: hypothetical protein ABI741_00930 [Ferruginibacter sp.]
MKAVKFFTAFVLMLAISTATNAQAARSRIQEKRIEQGARNGNLTHRETRRLERQQRHIRHERREARADGVVTSRERRALRKDERRANRNIHRKRHNRRDRI